jgi:hypothetical protein
VFIAVLLVLVLTGHGSVLGWEGSDVSLEVVGWVGGVAVVAALVAGVLIRRHARRAVGRADLTPAVTADPPELAGHTLDELLARHPNPEAKADLTPAVTADPSELAGPTLDEPFLDELLARHPNPEAKAVDKFDSLLADLGLSDAEAKTDVTEVQWRDEVSKGLARLQKELKELRAENKRTASRAKNQEQRRAPGRAWLLASILLGVSIVLVIIGINMGLGVQGHQDAAKEARARVASDQKAVQVPPSKADLAAAAKCKGLTGKQAQWNCFVKADPTYANRISSAVDNSIQKQLIDQIDAQANDWVANKLALGGPAVVAFASVVAGAAAGWMLPQWFERRVGEPESLERDQL